MLSPTGTRTISSTSSRRSTRGTTVASASPASRSGRRAGSPTSPRTSCRERPQRDGRGLRVHHRPGRRAVRARPLPDHPFEMQHIGVLSLGYRIEAGGRARLHGRHGAVRGGGEAREGCRSVPVRGDVPELVSLYPFHLSASQAAELATAAASTTSSSPISHPSSTTASRSGRRRRRSTARSTSRSRGWSSRSGGEPATGRARSRPAPSGRLRGRLPGVGRRVRPVLDGEDARAVRRLRVDRAALAPGTGKGWVTAEYSMLPASTTERSPREVNRGAPAAGPRRSSG